MYSTGTSAGTVDFNLIKQKKIEDTFYNFVEGRALRGKNKIYNYENGWYQDLLACSSRADMQMCETCGRHCNSWEWETSGYAVLNGSELDMATLIWLTADVYVSESVLLSASVCVHYDWWLCLRRLDENVQTFVLA
uniref:Uncharacterized protein n=1 Tax=Cryptomonas curvata TaxID=233186 RepID=A0A7S0QLA1_9CRYP|mmetsp:Transcript_38710/g.81241  ORF Transcript_38710/g.81241 Transcript_38710/m.81241 type:complete len:136 (+) Transcript_38710:60-467(+)